MSELHRDGYDKPGMTALPCVLCGTLPGLVELDGGTHGLMCFGCHRTAAPPARTWEREYERWNKLSMGAAKHNPERIGEQAQTDEARTRLAEAYGKGTDHE